jgi:hypothetical protein
MDGPDYSARDAAGLVRIFEFFGEVECPQLDAHLYESLCRGIVEDEVLLEMASHAPPNQPPPNLLFAAVQYLLLGGVEHRLRDWYPGLAGDGGRDAATVFPAFRDFCLAHRAPIVDLIGTRLVQTNVIQRSSALLPGFARVFEERGGRPLALVEIGPSAGLNLRWDRFRYRYEPGGLTWGDPHSRVEVPCDVRGELPLPVLPQEIPVASRRGVDIHPIDVDDADSTRWLRALIWPDHPGRQQRLSNAIEVARKCPAEIVTGDASRELGRLIRRAPEGTAVCVYGTHTLYQFPRDILLTTLREMQRASRERPVDFLSMEGSGDRCSELRHTRYRDGERETLLIANCNPHGRWLEWLL